MPVTSEREDGGDDDEVEPAVVEGRAQLGQIGLMQDEGAPPTTGKGGDGVLGAGDDIRADERGDADVHGSRPGGAPASGLGGDGVEHCQRGMASARRHPAGPDEGAYRSRREEAESRARRARASMRAKPSKFSPRHLEGTSANSESAARPIPQIRSNGEASTSTRSRVPSR